MPMGHRRVRWPGFALLASLPGYLLYDGIGGPRTIGSSDSGSASSRGRTTVVAHLVPPGRAVPRSGLRLDGRGTNGCLAGSVPVRPPMGFGPVFGRGTPVLGGPPRSPGEGPARPGLVSPLEVD